MHNAPSSGSDLLRKLLIDARAVSSNVVGISRKLLIDARPVSGNVVEISRKLLGHARLRLSTVDNLSRKLLIGAWAMLGTVLVGTVVWIFFTEDSIYAELERQQPSISMTFAGEGNAPAKHSRNGAPRAKNREKKEVGTKRNTDAGRRAAQPNTSENKKTNLPLAKKPLLSKKLKKFTLRLHPHPDPQLVERATIGPLPIVSKDGRQAWRVYSRPFSKLEKKPRIAIVFIDLGVSADATEAVIQKTPGAVTLAFAPFARRLKDWINISRSAGHEVLVALPMEPLDYPNSDPGPYTLLSSLSIKQNKQRLRWVLSRLTGYVGVSTFMAGEFTTKPGALKPVVSELKSRGLMMLDVRENPLSNAVGIAKKLRMPVAARDIFLDEIATGKNIRARLAQAEEIAKRRGFAVAIARPYPISVTEVSGWAENVRERGLALAPITAIAQESLK
ncbi:MAG: hypothetical protein CMM28_13750 [Rhodospirillaceae bacterium]|nr:hypothetical protein [Rhodospirillaceae bacterium]